MINYYYLIHLLLYWLSLHLGNWVVIWILTNQYVKSSFTQSNCEVVHTPTVSNSYFPQLPGSYTIFFHWPLSPPSILLTRLSQGQIKQDKEHREMSPRLKPHILKQCVFSFLAKVADGSLHHRMWQFSTNPCFPGEKQVLPIASNKNRMLAMERKLLHKTRWRESVRGGITPLSPRTGNHMFLWHLHSLLCLVVRNHLSINYILLVSCISATIHCQFGIFLSIHPPLGSLSFHTNPIYFCVLFSLLLQSPTCPTLFLRSV